MNSPQHVSTGVLDGDKIKNGRGISKMKRRCRTKFQQHWLHEDDENGDQLRSYILPVKEDKFKAICGVCYKSLNIDNAGKSAILQHARTTVHKKRMDLRKSGQML